MKKRSFTLFEIIISIILISVLYFFAINTFVKSNTNGQKNINLNSLKEKLLDIDYDDSISLKCVRDELQCFLFIDGLLQEEVIKNLFLQIPSVYEYNKNREKIEYGYLDLPDELGSYEIVFDYSCNRYKKCSEQIVELNTSAYIFNDIHMKPILVEDLYSVDEYFESKQEEVKDAF